MLRSCVHLDDIDALTIPEVDIDRAKGGRLQLAGGPDAGQRGLLRRAQVLRRDVGRHPGSCSARSLYRSTELGEQEPA